MVSPKFYCIYNSELSDSNDLQERLNSLKLACTQNKVEFVPMDECKVDFSKLPIPTKRDALYNCARGSYLLELALLNKEVKNVYRKYSLLSQKDDSNHLNIELKKHNISTPKTIFSCYNDRSNLRKYVEYLGGFPVIIKLYGMSGGQGVMIANDYRTLFSTIDYLVSSSIQFQLKEYIESATCERVSILGDEILFAFSRPISEGDFRSSSYEGGTRKITLTEDIRNLAIKSAHCVNLNFAGVDIITRKTDGKAFILEINCPHNFYHVERIFKENYSDRIIKWFFKKE